METPEGRDIEVLMLGSFEVRVAGHRIKLGGARQEKLLALLALNPDSLVTTGVLVTAIWGEVVPETAVRQVYNAVAALRRHLGSARTIIITEGTGYRAALDPECTDVFRFESGLATVRRLLASPDPGAADAAVDALHDALGLWRGPALDCLTGPTLEAVAIKLNEERLSAQEQLAELRLSRGESHDLIPELTRLVADNPFRERMATCLVLAMYRAGRVAEALAVYERVRGQLAEELGLDPSPKLQRIHTQILRNDSALEVPVRGTDPEQVEISPASVTAQRPPGEPERAAVTAEYDEAKARYQLPYNVNDFVGRAPELARLMAMTREAGGDAVVITALNGMAGIGKTTLAVRVGHMLADTYPDGQIFIDLQGHTPGLSPVPPAVALDMLLRSMGVPPERIPDGTLERVGVWRSMLSGKRILVVLDNAADAEQVRPLVPGTPGARVLITSRRRLASLDGVTTFSLDLLPHGDAVEMFRTIAGKERCAGEATAVHEVVALCGRLPLAIRIAASRFANRQTWTVAYLCDRLRDERRRLDELSDGRRSVAAAFHISYQHLSPVQQRAFRLLGLFPGTDFEPYTISALLGVSVQHAEAVLEELLDVHLLSQHEIGRYHMHDLLRRHAQRLSEEEPENERTESVRRLASYYEDLGAALDRVLDPGQVQPRASARELRFPELKTPEHVTDVVAAERGNIVAVLEAAHARGLDALTARLAESLCPQLLRQGYVTEALTGYAVGIEAARREGIDTVVAGLLRRLGAAHLGADHLDEALTAFEQAFELETIAGNTHNIARCLANAGIVHIRMGRYSQACDNLGRALVLLEGVAGTVHDQAFMLGSLGVAQTYLGRYPEAMRSHQLALRLNEEVGSLLLDAATAGNIGWIHTRLGDFDVAHSHLERSLALSRELGASEVECRTLIFIADCGRCREQTDEALDYARLGLIRARELGNRDIERHALFVLGEIHLDRGSVNEARACFERGLRARRPGRIDDHAGDAQGYEGLGRVAMALGDTATAAAHWDRAIAIAVAYSLPGVDSIRRRRQAIRDTSRLADGNASDFSANR